MEAVTSFIVPAMFNNEAASVSRATSVSRVSKTPSTRSRAQSLIKKNVAPQDLRPSDVLIERFVAWKAIVKQLIAYFEGVADIESNIAREYTKLGAVIQVPFRSSTQFLGEGGLQDVYYNIRDRTRNIADHHANLARTVDSSIVQHLHKLRTEIKAHIKNIQNDTGKLATSVAKERELSTRLIGELSTSISVFQNMPMSVTPKSDPYVVSVAVSRQLQKQVHEENALQKSIIIMQQNSAHFEEGVVRAIQSAWATFSEWRERSAGAVADAWSGLDISMSALAPDREWIAFAAREDHLLDPETPLRNPATIIYPGRDDQAASPVHSGYIERKKRFTRTYHEAFYVLTPAGFLHEYPSSDPTHIGTHTPSFSLFLPACTLGPPSSSSARSHKFHIEGTKDGMGLVRGGSIRRSVMGIGSGAHAWAFRARSREDMMEWWNDIRMLCARYLVASEQMERGGPVQAAVRSAGYVSEEEEEEEGSSVEEREADADAEDEDEDEDGEDLYQDADAEVNEELPSHSSGHAPEQKNGSSSRISKRPSQRQLDQTPLVRTPHVMPNIHVNSVNDARNASANTHDRTNSTITTGTSDVPRISAVEPQGSSTRGTQDQEDAPGPAPVESRFTEDL
ncbi:hypothetical protein J3A83DRAFT_4322666 [Scleroderma citrinum]